MRYASSILDAFALVALMIAVALCPGCAFLETEAAKASAVIYAATPPGHYTVTVTGPMVSGSVTYTKDEAASAALGHDVLVAPAVPAGVPQVIHVATPSTVAAAIPSTSGIPEVKAIASELPLLAHDAENTFAGLKATIAADAPALAAEINQLVPGLALPTPSPAPSAGGVSAAPSAGGH